MKQLDLNKTVAALVEEYPELLDIMAEIGFKEITKPISRRQLHMKQQNTRKSKKMIVHLKEENFF